MSRLQEIDHIVVLMLENRSFDNIFGWLYDPENEEPFQTPPRGQSFDGVSGKVLENPVPGSTHKIPVARGRVLTDPNPDPGEEFAHVARQMAQGEMTGFVADYILALQNELQDSQAQQSDYEIIMNCFTPEQLPVLSGLANQYAVCDRWFSSVPSQTLCNRCFSQSATSRGFVNNKPIPKWALTHSKTVFELLGEAQLDWKVYYDQLDLVPLTRLSQPSLWRADDQHFQTMQLFHQDAASGHLPPYSVIEPRFFLDHNDAHPPLTKKFLVTSSVAAAEVLVQEVYDSLRKGPKWDKTLLVVTFDEHGGCYDHVYPPEATPPEAKRPKGEEGFRFDQLGVRVPTLLISPWIEAGRVEHTVFDHSSLIKTVSQRWSLPSLTERDRSATDLSCVLSLEAPRRDQVEVKAHPYEPHPEHSKAPLLHLQRYILELIAAYEAYHQLESGLSFREKLTLALELLEKEKRIRELQTVGEAIDYMAEKLDPETGWFRNSAQHSEGP